jgi:hypothetical protein
MHQEPVCANCGIVVRWQPTIVDADIYCCLGCAQGGPCECDYDNLPPPDETNPMVLHRAQDPTPWECAQLDGRPGLRLAPR